jgi:hypothetical protein
MVPTANWIDVSRQLSPPCSVTAERSGEIALPSSYTIFHIVDDLIAPVAAAVIVAGEQVLYTMLAGSSPASSSYYLGAGGEARGLWWASGGCALIKFLYDYLRIVNVF